MMQDWFAGAQLGIFIHWGIYAAGDWGESWPFFHGEVPYDTYMGQARTFTAARYDPDAWAALFAAAGAKYSVLKAKHHYGFALWDTQLSPLNARDASPAGRDLLAPYCAAMRRHGLKVGLYFSHLDWSHPDYATVHPRKGLTPWNAERQQNPFAYPAGAQSPERWERFLEFQRGQLRELCERYAPDLLWFDGDWERDPEQWRFRELRADLERWAPQAILNSRMGGYGDYATPEQAIPISRPEGPWEFCVTINDSWGYQKKDHNFKSVRQCVRMLAECAGMGGNLLLDIGPRSDGTIPDEQRAPLEGLGRWTQRHGEALFGTVAGLPHGHFYGPSTLTPARDTLYLIIFDRPVDGIAVKGIRNAVRAVTVVGSGGSLVHRTVGGAPWLGLPGVLWIDVPAEALDPDATVVKVELDGPLDLYTGAGHAVTQNP